jgi:hypothetical protein
LPEFEFLKNVDAGVKGLQSSPNSGGLVGNVGTGSASLLIDTSVAKEAITLRGHYGSLKCNLGILIICQQVVGVAPYPRRPWHIWNVASVPNRAAGWNTFWTKALELPLHKANGAHEGYIDLIHFFGRGSVRAIA